MKLFKNKRGVVMYYIIFIIVAFIILFISAVLAPMGTLMTTELYTAGEGILADANESISNIQDAEVKATLLSAMSEAQSATQDNIEVNLSIYQYGWVFVVIIAFIIIFMQTRQAVEYSNRYGGFI